MSTIYEVYYNPEAPSTNCTRLCGNISVPFPFGIKEGCYANDNLRLNCTINDTTLILDRGYAQYRVTNLSLDDGLLMVTNMLNDTITNSNNMERVVLTNNGSYNYGFNSITDGNYDFSQEDTTIKWFIANITCQEAMQNNATYACVSDNSICKDVMRGNIRDGYRCKCSDGFQGNPYLQNNCTGYIPLSLCKLISARFLVSLTIIYLVRVLINMMLKFDFSHTI